MGKYLTGWPNASPSQEGDMSSPSPPSPTPPRPTTGLDANNVNGSFRSSPPPPPLGAVPAPSLPYDLHAVVNHSGSMAQGHYTAFVKELGRWFRFDDTWVKEVDEQEVLQSEAYLLFYFQRGADTRWKRPQDEAAAAAAAAAAAGGEQSAVAVAAAAANINDAFWPPANVPSFSPPQSAKKRRS